MARKFFTQNNTAGTAGGSAVDVLSVQSPTSPTIRPRLYEVLFSSVATPADYNTLWALFRASGAAATGGTSKTPTPLDAGDPASSCTAMSGLTLATETVGTAALLQVAVNLRATFRWVAVPGCELVFSNVNFGGIVAQTITQSTSHAVNCGFYWEE